MEVLRHFFYKRSIRSRRPKIGIKGPIQVRTAKHVGILFNASEVSERDQVINFSGQLSKQKFVVHLLGFLDEKGGENEELEFDYFNLKNVNFAKIPTGEKVEQFVSQKYDVLINLDDKDSLPLHYISAIVDAPMKVGPPSIDENSHYNLMIEASGENRLQSFISEMRKTLNKIV